LYRNTGIAVPNKKRNQDFGMLQSHHCLAKKANKGECQDTNGVDAIKSNADLSQDLTRSLSVTQATQGSRSKLKSPGSVE
jgi:hypothetical protein